MEGVGRVFRAHNVKLLNRLIDNELPEARGCVDPMHEDFYKPLKEIYYE